MSLLDPIVPYLGPLGPALAVSGTLVVILGLIGNPISVPIAIVSNLFLPLVENGISSTPPLVCIEFAFLAPLGAIYSSFVYERAVLHMGDYHARLRRFLEQGQKGKKAGPGST